MGEGGITLDSTSGGLVTLQTPASQLTTSIHPFNNDKGGH